MNCEELEPWISAFQDGELDSRRRQIVEAHLAGCPECRALSRGWADLARDVRMDLGRLETPERLHARVMSQIPAPAARAAVRSGSRWPRGWPSFALAPAAAAAGWLLWVAHPMPRIPPPSRLSAAVPAVEAVSPTSVMAGTLPVGLPANDLSMLRLTKLSPSGAGAGERPKKAAIHSKPVPAPAAESRSDRTQGRRPTESDAVRRLRRLRPRRVRYPLAQYRPGDALRPRRQHPWRTLAARPQRPPVAEMPPAPVPTPHIHVVEYVLPAVQPAASAVDAESDYVLRSVQQTQVIEAGFDL
jgi:hypothetical protein